MSENLHSDPTMRMMYNDALLDLMAGAVNQIDKEVLSYTPLPDSVIDPYVSQEVQAKAAMELTYSSLSTWIDEAKKASYFTKHFVVLSKMINNGVASMARGLATLHACGEDLSVAPMSVQDLIMVASYHIRKSYLGVMQTSRSHPEIGEQLVLNQLGWTNTLLRLFKTKEKLAKPVCKDPGAGIESQMLPAPKTECGGSDDVSALSGSGELDGLPALPEQCGLGELPALSEPGSYGPVRAFGAYAGDRSRKTGEIRNKKKEIRNSSEADGKIEIRENEKTEIADGNEKPEEESTDGNYGITKFEKGFRIQDSGVRNSHFHDALVDPDLGYKNEKSVKENSDEKEQTEEWPEDENDDFSEEDFFEEEDFLNFDRFEPLHKGIPIPVRNVSKKMNGSVRGGVT